MRRILMGLLVVSAMACDSESVYDGGLGDETELGFDHELADELAAEDDALASGGAATVKLVSWVQDGEAVSKVYCDDFTQTGASHCYCNEDSSLTGALNSNNGADKCVLCRWWEWPDGTCALGSSNDVNVEFVSNGKAMHTYVNDDAIDIVPSGPLTDPAPSWTLSHCEPPSSCTCADAECTCGEGYLGFATQVSHGSGTTSAIVANAASQIQLATGMCGG